MGTISKQYFFKAPVVKVWSIWADVEKTPDWVEGVKESKILSSVRTGKGLEWEEKCAMGGQTVQMQHEAREWDENKKTVYATKLPMGADMETSAEFRESLKGETELDVSISWNLGILSMMISDEKFEEMIDKAFSKTLERLKNKAEQA